MDGKLSSAQALLHQQDESLRRGERERRALNERIKELERLSLNAEAERKRVEVRGCSRLNRSKIMWTGCNSSRPLQEQCSKLRAGEARLEAERRRLREALEAAEGRGTRVELGRRSLEGELQRLRLSLAEREMEIQTAHDRHESAVKQVPNSHQRHLTHSISPPQQSALVALEIKGSGRR